METKNNNILAEKQLRLLDLLKQYANLGIAFSGGVDSTLLLAAAQRALGHKVYALTAVSPIHPSGEKQMAIDLAKQLGVQHIVFESNELDNLSFLSNPPDRCYYCKKGLLKTMSAKARAVGVSILAHGANCDDLSDYRPGFKAAQEMGIVAPLIDAQLTKSDIRELAKQWGLPNWDRPAMACLATRIPYGTPIDIQVLNQVDRAEQFLQQLGVSYCRVRHHGDLARIEVAPEDIERLTRSQTRRQIVNTFRDLGYLHISIDLEGYTSGKMNRSINE